MYTTGCPGRRNPTKCTGNALITAEAHAADAPLTLFGSCFCPFVQRTWMTLEYLGIPYKYYEINPYQKPKPQELLDVSPKGLVPALKLNEYIPPRALNESTVIMTFLEELAKSTEQKRSLLPPASDPYARSLVRLQADHVNRVVVPAFYRYLQAQDPERQVLHCRELHEAIDVLVRLFGRVERELGNDLRARKYLGLWMEGGELGWTDVMVAPWIYRADLVLKYYRGFELPRSRKFSAWIQRLFNHPAFKATCSTDDVYIANYEPYAYNRPNTSQVADAINAGKALP
ncbi:hypothetical protein AX17_004354 [Amanita inopinata Kibby_2008]|nr:hypothetical protein AX17_004354 [Amanita inopinata Kibby_2008]